MRDLDLYLDSKLKDMKLFNYAQKIVRSFHIDESFDIPNKSLALDLYADFVELASLVDEYDDWGTKEWDNFVTMMNLAFKEKGKEDSLAYALVAISGISLTVDPETNKLVSIKDVYTIDPQDENNEFCTTEVTIRISRIGTPFTSKFLKKFQSLIERLYWVHELVLKDPEKTFKTVEVKIRFEESYEKIIYSRQIDLIDLMKENPEVPEGWEV